MKKFLVAVGGLTAAAALIYLFFAPTFSGSNEVNPIIQVGSFNLRYYGLLLGVSILISYAIARMNAWRFGLGQDEVDKLAFWLILIAFISARLYYVLFNSEYFFNNPSEIIKIWNGGLAIYGAVIGGFIFLYFFARKKAYTVWQLLDLAALSLPLGQAIGRLGNFFNYEAYGSPTNLPWKMYVPELYRNSEFNPQEYFHPTFLYEVVGNIIIFAILFYYRGKLKSGNLALIYLLSYTAVRFFIEPLRLDSMYIGQLRLNQIVSGLIFLIAILLVYRRNFSFSKKA